MLFNSYFFLLFFLPIAVAGYYILKYFKQDAASKVFLIAVSLWFCGYYNMTYVYVICGSMAFNYIFHRILLKTERVVWRKVLLFISVTTDVGLLFYFKYYDFFVENINKVFQSNFDIKVIILPLGISFFTFQQISFLVDTYRKELEQESILDYCLFVTFFPKLVEGPIAAHKDLIPQFQNMKNNSFDKEMFYKGIILFVCGLAKKVLIADTISGAVDWGYTYSGVLNSVNVIVIFLLYTLQLYFDFSGYCDMARGLGYFFGIRIPLNFLSPYKSKNIVDFWKTWHITLGRFFVKYIYIPLGGNRKGQIRTIVNIMIVFLVSGFWHGASWTFIFWGFLQGIMNSLVRIWHGVKQKLKIPSAKTSTGRTIGSAISIFLNFCFVVLTMGIFRAQSMEQIKQLFGTLTDFHFTPVFKEITDFLTLTELEYIIKLIPHGSAFLSSAFGGVCLAYAFFFVVMYIVFGCKNLYEMEKNMKPGFIRTTSMAVLFIWSIMSLSQVSSFLYFNF